MNDLRIAGYEGPRAPRPDEWEAVLELSRSIFFPAATTYREAAVRWPMALQRDFQRDSYTMFLNGQPVSNIGRLERAIVVHGHALRMGFIGGVCTHPNHRGKGLASAILQASLAKLRENDVDFVYISGARSMYYGVGANHIGGHTNFTVQSGAPFQFRGPEAALRPATTDDIALLIGLSEKEGLRFLRAVADYELSLRHGHCSGKACSFRVIEVGTVPVGYVLVTRPTEKEPHTIRILEYVGDRCALMTILPALTREAGQAAIIAVPHSDPLHSLLGSAGIQGQPGRTSGTIKLLDFDRTLQKLRGYFAERMPAGFVDALTFAASPGKYVAWSNKDVLEIEGENHMLWTLLGCPAGQTIANVRASEMMKIFLLSCFPLPLPSMHLNVI
jgi:predicted N-acetyltransferase YhbS